MPKPRAQDHKKTGFRLGPKLGKGVYQGHTQKIKATLIHKARVKKAYHKDLAAEGYEGTGANGGELGARSSGKKAAKPNPAAQRRGPEEEGDEETGDGNDEEQQEENDDDDDDDDDSEDEGRTPKGGRQPKPRPKGKGPAPRSQPPSRTLPSTNAVPTPATAPLPIKRPRLTDAEVEKIKEGKIAERKEWGKRSARGQPKLGGRVEMLLLRIKKSMA